MPPREPTSGPSSGSRGLLSSQEARYGASVPFRTRRNIRNRSGGVLRPATVQADQPRPALGRRPWFALLRRALSLRRFAFAITNGSVPAGRRYQTIVLSDGGGFDCRVGVAVTFRERLRGLRPAPPGRGLLLRGASVHGRGMIEPLTAIFLDASGSVLAVCRLHPGGFVRHPAATWTLELPVSISPPPVGARLEPRAGRHTGCICEPRVRHYT